MSAMAPSAPLEDTLRTIIEAEPAVLAAWLFGSHAHGTERVSSDADVAVLLVRGTSNNVLTRLTTALTGALGIEADVVDLASSTPLGFEIVAHGRRVFERDALAADEAEERCLREYLDTEHMRRVQQHYLYGDPL